MPWITEFKKTLLHAALFKQAPLAYSSLAYLGKAPAFQANTLAIRKLLIDSISERNLLPSLKSIFGITPIKSKLFDFRKYLPQKQLDYVKSLDRTCHQLILPEHLSILKTFYASKQKEQSLLGELYRHITFEQMVHRFIQARYAAAYLDGRLLEYRTGHEILHEPLSHCTDREKLLAVGTAEDTGELYKYYLTIEETALSHLVSASGYFLAISNGIRPSKSSAAVLNIREQLEKAHLSPVLVNYAVGPEFRNGRSLHYDALMCIEYHDEKHGHPHYDRRQVALTQEGFSSVAEAIYGQEFPHGPKSREHCERISFPVSDTIFQSKNAFFYVNAYKHRLKHTLKQTLIANELLMPEPGTFRLKGLSLGAFAIDALGPLLEKLYLSVLKELLQTLPLKKIKRIELLNFPSIMTRHGSHSGDIDYFMNYTSGIRTHEPALLDSPIPVEHLLAPCLSQSDDRYLATQVCGDSISLPGNEANVGLPPRSSDEATMYYALAGMTSLCETELMQHEELATRILVTDGETCKTLAGDDRVVDLSCVSRGHIEHPILIETEPTLTEDAIEIMDALNAVRGVAAALDPAPGNLSTITIQIQPTYNRNSFFAIIDKPSTQETTDNEFLPSTKKP